MAMALSEFSFPGLFSYDFEESLKVVASVEKAGRSQHLLLLFWIGPFFPDLNLISKCISKSEHHILSDTVTQPFGT